MHLKINHESISLLHEIKVLQEQLQFKQRMLHEKDREINAFNEQIESLKNQFTEYYNFNPSALITINQNYIIQTVNFQAALLLNYDRGLLVNKNFLNLINIYQQSILKKRIKTVLERQIKQICEIELLPKGGERKYVRIECFIAKEGQIELILDDITVIRQLESEQIQLKQSLETFTHLLQNVSDAIATLDKEFYFKIINPSFVRFFSKIFALKISAGMNFFSLISDFSEYKQELINACNRALLGEETTILIENYNDSREANFCFEINFNPIYNPSSQKIEIILLIKDLTTFSLKKQLRMQEQSKLTHAIRLNTMESMASALAHEINQPLTAIFLYAQTCLLQWENNKQHQTDNNLLNFLNKIISQAQHASKVMSRMKSFIVQNECYHEETDLNSLIKDAMIFLNYELTYSKLKVSFQLDEELPNLYVDRIQIMQVILNLARNSIEAMQEEKNDAPELSIKTMSTDEYIEVHIRDNGPGITLEQQEKILNSYFTTKPQGTGLGLTICQNLVEEHGGKLYVKNSKVGAWFIFTLPKPVNF